MYRLLIIEDDNLLAETLRDCFESTLYHISISNDGLLGYKLAKTAQFDLIILDWILPNRSGLEIVKSLRSLSIETPILIISTKNNIHDIVTGLKSGGDGYICKPFNLLEFKTRVETMLKRPPKSKMRALKIASISLNPASGNIKISGKRCVMRKKEYLILKYFMENPNIVLTREQILNNVWSSNDDPYLSSVDVHINRIRDKIDKPFGTKYLQTVHGIGYKLSSTNLV